MTAKEFVISKMPKARSEKQKTNGKEVYYLIREIGNTGYFSHGETESKAWKNAKEKIIESENLKQNETNNRN